MGENFNILPPRADLNRSDFENLIYQKGREVLFEKALPCPCKSESTNQQGTCQNCGGAGWLFVNPKTTRMLVTGVSVTNEYKPWSEEARGMVNVTCQESESLSFMDRITLLDGKSIHNEVLFFNLVNNNLIAFSSYPIKHILISAMFVSTEQELVDIPVESFTIGPRNRIILSKTLFGEDIPEQVSITLKYYFAPSYCIVEMKRETMQSFRYVEGSEQQQNFPVSALARRTHYELKPINNVTIDNTLTENKFNEGCITIIPSAPPPTIPPPTFCEKVRNCEVIKEIQQSIEEIELTPGPKGDDGKSAYEIWLDEGNVGTEEDFLLSLKGNTGNTGEDGVGISNIELISTVGLIKTYRITLTNSTTYTFEVTDGAKGDKGDTGNTGPQGPAGTPPAALIEYYGEASYTAGTGEEILQSFEITPDKWSTQGVYFLKLLGRHTANGTVTNQINIRLNTSNTIVGSTLLRDIRIATNSIYNAQGGHMWGIDFHLWKNGNNLRYDSGVQTGTAQVLGYSDIGYNTVVTAKILANITPNFAGSLFLIVTCINANTGVNQVLSNLLLKKQ